MHLGGEPQRRRRSGEAAVDQHVGNAGLALHPVGQRDVGVGHRAEVEHEVGLGRDQALEAHRVAAAGQPAGLRQVARRRRQELLLRRRRQTDPADHRVGRQHIHQHRCGRPGDEHAVDVRRQGDLAVGRIDDRAARALRPRPGAPAELAPSSASAERRVVAIMRHPPVAHLEVAGLRRRERLEQACGRA